MSTTEARLLTARRLPDAALVSPPDWRRPGVRRGLRSAHAVLFVLLVIAGLGPILWLAKSAITPTQDTLTQPMALFPNGIAWDNLDQAGTACGSACTSGTRSCSRSGRGCARSSSPPPAGSHCRCCGRSTRRSSPGCC